MPGTQGMLSDCWEWSWWGSQEKMRELQKQSFFNGIPPAGTGKPEERKKRLYFPQNVGWANINLI